MEANSRHGLNCGPHALGAALGWTLPRVRQGLSKALAPAGFRGFMNPTEIGKFLRMAAATYRLVKLPAAADARTKVLCDGINRIQWEGPWLNPGVPPAAAYAHTHYVAYCLGSVMCTAVGRNWEWVPFEDWFEKMSAEPWHVTHHWIIED